MISPMESLALTIQASPGVYAVLAGSGVSRAAKIPTGWEITLDLVRRLAACRRENCGPEPARWYRKAFGRDPDYSDLLGALCRTEDERRLLLRGYFEPCAHDSEEGAKGPTAAHRAIAALAAGGYIRVILTTNFDRMIETALDDAGVTPTILSTREQVSGALPLVHTRCCVVKLHGDYLDRSIKNTQAELDSYPSEVNHLLHRVLDEYGLVVCGWSATWDGALRKALERARSRRFTTYWAVHGEVEDAALRLIKQRGARRVPIKDADQFFDSVQQHVESLQEVARPHPLSTETAVASLKRYLAEPRHKIRLFDLIANVVEQVVETTRDDVTAANRDSNAVRNRMLSLEGACSTLLALAVAGGYWTEEEQEDHVRPWERALDRLGSKDWPASGGEIDLRGYPAMLLLHALGFGAVEAGRLSSLGRVLDTRIRTSYQKEQDAALALHPVTLSRSDPVARSAFGTPLRECLRPHTRRIVPDDTRYTVTFDKLEILLGLAYCCRRGRSDTLQARCDPFWNVPENGERFLNEIEASLSARGDKSPFVGSRIFGGTEEECRRRLEELRMTVRRRR